MDASDFQLGVVIIIVQGFRSIHFYSGKLSGTHKRYNVTQKELLRIVKTLKIFNIYINTDRSNISNIY